MKIQDYKREKTYNIIILPLNQAKKKKNSRVRKVEKKQGTGNTSISDT